MIFKPFINQKLNGLNRLKGLNGLAPTHLSSIKNILSIALIPISTITRAITTFLIITVTIYLWTIRSTEYSLMLSQEYNDQHKSRTTLSNPFLPDEPYSISTVEGRNAEQIIIQKLKMLPDWQTLNRKTGMVFIEKQHLGGPEYVVELDAQGVENTTRTRWTELWKISNPNRTQQLEFTITFSLMPPKINPIK